MRSSLTFDIIEVAVNGTGVAGAVAFGVVVMTQVHSAMQSSPIQRRNNRLAFGFAVVLGVQCMVAAVASTYSQLADANTADLVEIARCDEANLCASKGGAGRLGLFSGTLWERLLRYSLRSGGSLARAQSIQLGMLLLAAGITFVTLLRYAGAPAAVLALGIFLPLALTSGDFRSLDSPNAVALPAVVYFASTLLFAESGSIVFVCIACIALAAAVTIYITFVVLVPFHLAAVALWARKPIQAVAAGSFLLALVVCLDSMDAARAVTERVWNLPVVVRLAIASGIAALAYALRLMRRSEMLRSMAPQQRVRASMTASLIYCPIAVWLPSIIFGLLVPPPARYFAPAVFPLLFVAFEPAAAFGARTFVVLATLEALALGLLLLTEQASVIGRTPLVLIVTAFGIAAVMRMATDGSVRHGAAPLTQSPFGAIVLLCFALGVSLPGILNPEPAETFGFHLAEGEPIVSSLYSRGYTYPEIFGALQGPRADNVLALVAALDPNLFGQPAFFSKQEFSLLLLKVPHAAARQTHGIVTELPVDRVRTAVVVRGDPPFIDWTSAEVCRPAAGDGSQRPNCIKLLTGERLFHVGDYIAVVNSAAPQKDERTRGEEHFARPSWTWPEAPGNDRRYGHERGPLLVTMAVDTPGLGRAHIVRGGGLPSSESWLIKKVTGIEFEGALPAAKIRILDRQRSAGVIEFEVEGIENHPPWQWLRHLIEVTDDNAHLLDVSY